MFSIRLLPVIILNLSGFEYDCDLLSNIDVVENNSSFVVYPNPAHEFLSIKSSEKRIKNLLNYNLNGVLMNSYQLDHFEYQLDISHLPAGVYYLQINALFFEKIVVVD